MRRVHIWVKRSGDGGAAEILLEELGELTLRLAPEDTNKPVTR